MRNHLARYALLWLASIQMVFWFNDWLKIATIVSSFVYPALLVWTFSIPVVRGRWDRANRFARWSAAALVVLMVNAQLMRKNDLTYPVVSWTMYASRRPEVPQFTELVGVRTDGTEFQLELDNLVLSTMPYIELLENYHKATEQLEAGAADEITRRRALLEKIIVNLGTRQLRPEGESPPVRIELVKKIVAADGGISQRKVLFTANLPAAKGAR